MIGLGLSLTTRAVLGLSFSPLSLFAAGEQGILIDPSDLSTIFTDTAGATPVTAPGQTGALALDKSRGLVLGPELVTNGDFSAGATGWIVSAQCSIGSGVANIISTDGSFQSVVQNRTLTGGSTYELSFDVVSYTSGVPRFLFPGASIDISFATGTGRRVARFFVPTTATSSFAFARLSGVTNYSIDNISVRELPGNHLTQSTLTFRPAYQATPRRLAFDGGDDRLNSTYASRVAGSYAVRFNGSTAGRVAIGSQGATDGRAFLGFAADGSIAAGIGTQSATTIKGTVDVRNTWVTGAVTWNGATVRLYQDGVEVYSGAQAGAVNTTIPIDLGALNNNSTRAAFWAGSIGAAVAIDRVLTPTEIANLHNFWRTIA